MGYKIAYSPQTTHKYPLKKEKKIPVKWIVTGAFLIGLLAGGWKLLLPGDPEITQAALGHLAEDIRSGESLSQAITAFCQEIIDNE